jgi:hypothetical protein
MFIRIYEHIKNEFGQHHFKDHLLENIVLMMTMRNDTYHYRYLKLTDYYNDVGFNEFSKPNVYKICKEKFRLATHRVLGIAPYNGDYYEENTELRINKKKYQDFLFNNTENLTLFNPYIRNDRTGTQIDSAEKLAKFVIDGILFPDEMYFEEWKTKKWESTERDYFLNYDFYAFHNLFVNYDVRRLFLFQAMVIEKNAKIRDLFETKKRSKRINRFDYLEALMLGTRGEISDFIGEDGIYHNNKHIKYEGYDSEVIMFNGFETFDYWQYLHPEYHLYEYEEIYFIYVRIFQLLNMSFEKDSAECSIEEIFDSLEGVFPEPVISRALKIMIYSGLIIETRIGSRLTVKDHTVKDPFEQIKLHKTVDGVTTYGAIKTEGDTAAVLYYRGLINEFIYIYLMSRYYVSDRRSALRKKKLNSCGRDYIQDAKNEYFKPYPANRFDKYVKKERDVVLFLIVTHYISEYNVQRQIERKTRENFKKVFHGKEARPHQKSEMYYPWEKMLKTVRQALCGKIEYSNYIIEQFDDESTYHQERSLRLHELLEVLDSVYNKALCSEVNEGYNEAKTFIASVDESEN